jgi:hypothetical protein
MAEDTIMPGMQINQKAKRFGAKPLKASFAINCFP